MAAIDCASQPTSSPQQRPQAAAGVWCVWSQNSESAAFKQEMEAVRNNKQFKTKQRTVKTLTLLESQDTKNDFLSITLMLFKISAQNLVCLLLTLSTINYVSVNPIRQLVPKVPKPDFWTCSD